MKNCNIQFLVFVIFLNAGIAFTQNIQDFHHEVLEDEFVLVNKSAMERSEAYNNQGDFYFTRQVNVDSNGQNIVGDAANEPSIAVDPTNPFRMVVGWRQFDTTSSNFRQAGYGYSIDGGLTWTFPGVLDPGNFRSDPVLDFDAQGNFYYKGIVYKAALPVMSLKLPMVVPHGLALFLPKEVTNNGCE